MNPVKELEKIVKDHNIPLEEPFTLSDLREVLTTSHLFMRNISALKEIRINILRLCRMIADILAETTPDKLSVKMTFEDLEAFISDINDLIVQGVVPSQEIRFLRKAYAMDSTAHSLPFHEYVVLQKALQKMPGIINLDLDHEDLLKVAKGELVPSTTDVFDDVGEVDEVYESHYVFLERDVERRDIACEASIKHAKYSGLPVTFKDREDVACIALHEGQVLQIHQHGFFGWVPAEDYVGKVHDVSNGHGEVLLLSCDVSEENALDAVHEIMRRHPDQQTCPTVLFFKDRSVYSTEIYGIAGVFIFSNKRRLHSTKNQMPKLNGYQLSPNACVLYHGPHLDIFKNPRVIQYFSQLFPGLNVSRPIGHVEKPLRHRGQLTEKSNLFDMLFNLFCVPTIPQRSESSRILAQKSKSSWVVPKSNRPTQVKIDDMPRRRRPYTPWL